MRHAAAFCSLFSSSYAILNSHLLRPLQRPPWKFRFITVSLCALTSGWVRIFLPASSPIALRRYLSINRTPASRYMEHTALSPFCLHHVHARFCSDPFIFACFWSRSPPTSVFISGTCFRCMPRPPVGTPCRPHLGASLRLDIIHLRLPVPLQVGTARIFHSRSTSGVCSWRYACWGHVSCGDLFICSHFLFAFSCG